MSTLGFREWTRDEAEDEPMRQRIADETISGALEFMEAREREAGRAHLLPLLCCEVAMLICRYLATRDPLVRSWDPEASHYFSFGFHFRLMCTSLGYERVCRELERAAVMLEQKFISCLTVRPAA